MDNVQFKWCFLIYCSAVTLSFASSNSFASSYSLFFFLSLWPHFFYLLPNTANEARKEYGGRGEGPLCGRSRGTRNPTETQKSKIFLTYHFKYCFHFLRIKCLHYIDFTIHGLCVTWQLSELIWGFFAERDLFKMYMNSSKPNPLKLFSQSSSVSSVTTSVLHLHSSNHRLAQTRGKDFAGGAARQMWLMLQGLGGHLSHHQCWDSTKHVVAFPGSSSSNLFLNPQWQGSCGLPWLLPTSFMATLFFPSNMSSPSHRLIWFALTLYQVDGENNCHSRIPVTCIYPMTCCDPWLFFCSTCATCVVVHS